MRRDQLSVLGIQLPVLPTIVLGGLPGTPDWASRLERIGLDVVSSGASDDTSETYAAAVAAVPHRPVKATGAVDGARIVECDGPTPQGAYGLHLDEIVVIDAAVGGDVNAIARHLLAVVADGPSEWWVAVRGLEGSTVDAAAAFLDTVVDAVRHVRLFLAKQQFEQ